MRRSLAVRPLVLAVLVPAVCAQAQTPGRPRRIVFRASVDVSEHGLRLPVPQGTQAVPPAPDEIFTYRDREGRMLEARTPRAFWLASQRRGQWADGRGTRVTLARPTRMFPDAWPRRHVTAAEFARRMEAAEAPSSVGEFVTWVETFSGLPVAGDPVELRAPPRLAEALLIRFEPREPVRLGVAFRRRASVHSAEDDGRFFVLFEFDGPVRLADIERALPRSFLAGIGTVPRATDPAPSERFQARPAGEKSPSAAFEASRQRAIDSLRGRRGWWFVETPNYILVTDLTAGRARVVRQIQTDVERLRGVFARWMPPLAPIEAVSVIRIFSDGEDYEAHVGPGMAWSGGAWMPGRGELVIRSREWGSLREQQAWLLGTVYHEALHQYLFYALGGRTVGVWFNEGHAALFEGAEIRGGQVRIREVARYAETADRLVAEHRLDFDALLKASHSDFYVADGSEQRRHENYARAWVLSLYLRTHAAQDAGHPHAGFAARYLSALGRNASPGQASEEALDGERPKDLEDAVCRFWQSPSARRAALRFDATGTRAP